MLFIGYMSYNKEIKMLVSVAIPKHSNVPTRTYSFFINKYIQIYKKK